jgi:hypothetical protein
LKLAFCTYVRPLLEFSSQVWSPHYNYLIDKIESVQRFFTKRLAGLEKLTYRDRLHILGIETLERRRLIHDLIFCYKCLHGFIDVDCNFLTVKGLSRTRGNGMKLFKEFCSIDVRMTFFSNRIVDVWQSLPAAAVFSNSLPVYKRYLERNSFQKFLRYF